MQGIDLNLASRPFKNDTLPWAAFVVALLALGLLTAWNVRAYIEHSSRRAEIEDKKASIRTELLDLDRRDREALNQIDGYDLALLSARSAKANEVIRWKSFSWTRLFNKLQDVQPYDVQMTTIRPVFEVKSVDRRRSTEEFEDIERVPVSVEGVAKTLNDFLEFERRLIRDPHFDRVEPESTARDLNTGETVFRLRFRYDPRAPVEAQPEPETADEEQRVAADAPEAAVEPEPGEIDEAEVVVAEGPASPADNLAGEVTAADRIERPPLPSAAAGPDPAKAAERPKKRRGGRRNRQADRPQPAEPPAGASPDSTSREPAADPADADSQDPAVAPEEEDD